MHGPTGEPPESLRGLPLFALPEVVLFPHTLVPFHVFEARFRAMLDECLVGRRLLVVAGLRPGASFASADDPGLAGSDVFEVAGLGRVLSDRRFHDGRYNIFVHCIGRVRIVRHVPPNGQDAPFAMADVVPMEDAPPEGAIAARLEAAHRRLVSLTAGLHAARGEEAAAALRVLGTSEDPAVISHRLASVLIEDARDRQQVLEMPSALARCELLCDRLSRALVTVEPSDVLGTSWLN